MEPDTNFPQTTGQAVCYSPDGDRDLTDWINEVKEPKAHKRRIEKICSLLEKGKKRP